MSELRRKPEVDFYKILQVDADAEPEVVEAAYRALSKKYHPDVNPVPEAANRMAQINMAYGVLGDAVKRREYNMLRGGINHYIKPSTATASPSTSQTSVNTNYRQSSSTTNSQNTSYTRPASNTTSNYKSASTSNGTPKATNTNTSTPPSQAVPNRPRNPYQAATPPNVSARSEAQNRAKGGNRAGHYVYDSKKKLTPGILIAIFCMLVIIVVVLVLLQESFLGNPLGTHFVTRSLVPSATTTFIPIEQFQTSVPTATSGAPQLSSDFLNRENALAFLEGSSLFAGRIGQSQNDLSLSGDTLQLKVKLSDKGAGSNSDIAAISATQSATPTTDSLVLLRNSETTAYAVIYPLFRQFSPQLKHIVLGLTNPTTDNIVYRVDVTREAAFGFYPWQTINANMPISDLVRLATDDRLASHFGAPQDDKQHSLLLNPDEATITAEIASRGIEATTATIEPSGTAVVSYLLNHNIDETQLDFVKIIYALYTRFPNFDRLELTTTVAGQNGGTTVWCNRELFDKVGVATWAQKLYIADVQEIFSSLPKTEAILKQQTTVNPPTPQAVNTTLRVRTWQVEVIKTEQINGVASYTPNGNSQLWAITVQLRNGSSQQLYPMPDEIFSLADSQHHLYQPDIPASVQYNLNNNFTNLAPLPPGQSERLTLIFSLPRTTNNQKLSLQVRDSEVKGQIYLQ